MSAVNAVQTLTQAAAPAGQAHYITSIEVAWVTAPTAPVAITVESPAGTVLVRARVATAEGRQFVFANPLKAADAAAALVTVAAGVGAISEASFHGYTK